LKNKAIACDELGLYDEATKIYSELINGYSEDDDYYHTSEAFFNVQNLEIGYRFSELYAIADAGCSGFLNLSEDIIIHRVARIGNSIRLVRGKDIVKLILPLLYKTLSMTHDEELEYQNRVFFRIRRLLKRLGSGSKKALSDLTKAFQNSYDFENAYIDFRNNQQAEYNFTLADYVIEESLKVRDDFVVEVIEIFKTLKEETESEIKHQM
jgi:tetratricopeptide (TPR) repeat protein